MATEYDLTTDWVEIFDGSGFMAASFQGRGEVVIDDADTTPSSASTKGHKITGGGTFVYGGQKSVYARALDSTASIQATVTQVAHGGLTGITGMAFVSLNLGV